MDPDTQPELASGIADVNDVPISELWSLANNPNLARAMLRAQGAVKGDPEKSVCAFNSAI